MNSAQILRELKDPKKNFHIVKSKFIETNKTFKLSDKLNKSIANCLPRSITGLYNSKVMKSYKIVPYLERSDDFELFFYHNINDESDGILFYQITITRNRVIISSCDSNGDIDEFYNNENGLSTEDFFTFSLIHDLPDIILYSEVQHLRKNLPKKLRRCFLHRQLPY